MRSRLTGSFLFAVAALMSACGPTSEVAAPSLQLTAEPATPVPVSSATSNAAPSTTATTVASASASPSTAPSCSPELLASVIDKAALISATPSATDEPRILTVTCRSGESLAACEKRAKEEALRGAVKGATIIDTMTGNRSSGPGAVATVEVDGKDEHWSVENAAEAGIRAEALAATGRKVKVKSFKAPAGKQVMIMVKEPIDPARKIAALLTVQATSHSEATRAVTEIDAVAKAKGVLVTGARVLEGAKWEAAVECKR